MDYIHTSIGKRDPRGLKKWHQSLEALTCFVLFHCIVVTKIHTPQKKLSWFKSLHLSTTLRSKVQTLHYHNHSYQISTRLIEIFLTAIQGLEISRCAYKLASSLDKQVPKVSPISMLAKLVETICIWNYNNNNNTNQYKQINSNWNQLSVSKPINFL